MRDKELWLNGSGYPDPTAYKAMKGVFDMEIKVGQIWSTETNSAERRPVLILAVNGDVCTVINAREVESQHSDISIYCGEKSMYLCSSMLQYFFKNKLVELEHTVSDDQFDYVMDKVASSLGIEFDDSEELECAKEVIKVKNTEIERLKKQFDEVVMERDAEIKQLSDELQDVIMNDNPSEDMVRLETERDLYKSLYEQTLERLLTR